MDVCLLFSWYECKWKCKGSDMSESLEFINLHVNVHVKMKTRSLSTFVYKQKVSRDFTRCLVKMFPSNKRKQYLYHEMWNTLNWNGHQKYQKRKCMCVFLMLMSNYLWIRKTTLASSSLHYKLIIMVLLWKFKTIFQMSKPNYRLQKKMLMNKHVNDTNLVVICFSAYPLLLHLLWAPI